ALRFPYPGKIRLAVGCSRRWRFEVRCPVRQSRNAGGRMIQPLGVERNGDKKREHQRRGESANDFHLETSQCPDSTTACPKGITIGVTAASYVHILENIFGVLRR